MSWTSVTSYFNNFGGIWFEHVFAWTSIYDVGTIVNQKPVVLNERAEYEY